MLRIITLLSIITISIHSSLAQAQEASIVGVTAVTGAIYGEKETDKVALNNALIRFNGFSEKLIGGRDIVPLASYSTLFEFENTSDSYLNVPGTFPTTLFFTEFDKNRRSTILDNLAQIMPEVIDLKGDAATIKTNLQKKFQNRLFIRKFFNPRDLVKLHMDIKAYQDGKEIKINRIMLEFKMVKDERKKTDILVMDTKFQLDMQFKPRSSSTITVEVVTPSFKTGTKQKYYYAPFMTGHARTWKGNIKSLYIINDIIESAVALPYYMKYDLYNFKYNKNLLVIKNYEPEKFEKIGFYSEKEAYCNCGTTKSFSDRITLPKALKNVSASSYFSGKVEEKNACYSTANDVVVVKFVPDFDNSDNYELGFIKEPLTAEHSGADKIKGRLENECDGNTPAIEFAEPYHPVWAFDIGMDSLGIFGYKEEGYFNLQTAWCEGASGNGIGEYIEFEITQPVDFIKFFTGHRKDDRSYSQNNRVRMFELHPITAGEKRLFLFSDELISSSYEVDLPPGIYRLYIKDIYKGTVGNVTCFSDIILSFTIDDPWLLLNYPKLKL